MDPYVVLDRLTDRFLALLRGVDDADGTRPVPGLEWTVGECAAHVLSLFRRMSVDPRRAVDRPDLVRLNATSNAELRDDLSALAEQIEQMQQLVRDRTPLIMGGRRFAFHAGLHVTYEQAGGVMVGELAVHGDDLARATGRRWDLTPADVEPVWRYAIPLLRGWLRPEAVGVEETWQFVAPAGPVPAGATWRMWRDGLVLALRRGELSLRPGTAHADHVVVVTDPVALTLVFPYQRRPADSPELARLVEHFQPI
jgi:hypothetical protein